MSDRYVDKLEGRIAELEAELKLWRPMTSKEAEEAFANAKAEPMSEEQIQRIMKRVLDPAERVDNIGQTAMAVKIQELEAENKRLREKLEHKSILFGMR